MSLAGLDAPAVVEAHQASTADSTGWFVLKYQDGSRDTIEVLGQGSGGVNEARKVIETYTEKSPLYGLVQHRRKKIILQFVPDGTSRVLQVRLKVQFQSVLDTFTPHDTVFSFTQASELTESALALATMLLPSTGSVTSSDSSLRRRRLNDISEDGDQNNLGREKMKKVVEGEVTPSIAPAQVTIPETEPETMPFDRTKDEPDELPASALRAKALLAKRKEVESSPPVIPAAAPASPLKIPETQAESDSQRTKSPSLQPAPTFGLEKSLPAIPVEFPQSNTDGFEDFTDEYLTKDREEPSSVRRPEPRHSLTAEHLEQSRYASGVDRNSIHLWNDDVTAYAAVKPKKKKLGPRPHVDGATRPRTSGAIEFTIQARPVANLPTSIRVSNNRTPTTSARPGSQQSSKSVPGSFPPSSTHPSVLPPLPSPTHPASLYRPDSRPAISRAGGSITGESTANATPEKLRLMKALQLRKRNMLLTQRTSASTQASANSNVHSESIASSNTSRGIYPSGPTIKSDGNGHLIEPTNITKETAFTTSPTTATSLSEEQPTQASSFTSRDEAARRRASLSSDTSSSVTPKPDVIETKKRSSRRKSPDTRASPKTPRDPAFAIKVPTPDPASGPKSPTSPVDEAYARLSNTTPEPLAQDVAEQSPQPDGPAASKATFKGRRQEKERLKPAPLQIVSSAEHSEVSDNDSLMDELQNATVQEAKPVSVARTPVTPVISRVSTQPLKDVGKPASTPLSQSSDTAKSPTSLEKPKSAGGRSISTALPQWPPSNVEPVPLTKKATLGSGISKRIKALETVSSRQSTSPPRQPPREATSATRSAFSTFTKRASLIMHQQTPNTSTESSPPQRIPERASPKKERSEKEQPVELPKFWKQRQEPGGVLAPPPKGETVSVTARIIRDDPETVISQTPEANEYMYRSPLIVEHERPNRDATTAGADKTAKTPKSEKGRFSFSSHRSQSHPKLPSESLVSKLTFGGSRNKLPRSTSDYSSIADERPKSSRAGRLIKRVSNMSAGRKSTKDLTSHSEMEHSAAIEEDERESRHSMAESLLHVVDIGDVNVQFPDSMLWKRRFIRIDDQGYLIFSPPANDANIRAISRKYHLGDSTTPCLPDAEREEMANSIILDMKDGSCLQCACESKSAQRQVLQMLVDAHSAYHQLYGS